MLALHTHTHGQKNTREMFLLNVTFCKSLSGNRFKSNDSEGRNTDDKLYLITNAHLKARLGKIEVCCEQNRHAGKDNIPPE